jgi:hypothetical protein
MALNFNFNKNYISKRRPRSEYLGPPSECFGGNGTQAFAWYQIVASKTMQLLKTIAVAILKI